MRSAPALAPLFRSETQLRLLGTLFVTQDRPWSISELAERIGMSQPTVSREVARLAEHRLVNVQTQGRNRLVEANEELPWYRELRNLVVQIVGPPALLAKALGPVSGIARAFVFGSWATRYHGEPGPFPWDVDVLVVGSPSLDEVHRACRDVEHQLHVDVNPVVVSEDEWEGAELDEADGFLAQLRAGPLVAISVGGFTPDG